MGARLAPTATHGHYNYSAQDNGTIHSCTPNTRLREAKLWASPRWDLKFSHHVLAWTANEKKRKVSQTQRSCGCHVTEHILGALLMWADELRKLSDSLLYLSPLSYDSSYLCMNVKCFGRIEVKLRKFQCFSRRDQSSQLAPTCPRVRFKFEE